jgi:pyruvate kinase
MRRAKIVCTLGPATDDAVMIDRMIAAGMNMARLNLSHGAREGH